MINHNLACKHVSVSSVANSANSLVPLIRLFFILHAASVACVRASVTWNVRCWVKWCETEFELLFIYFYREGCTSYPLAVGDVIIQPLCLLHKMKDLEIHSSNRWMLLWGSLCKISSKCTTSDVNFSHEVDILTRFCRKQGIWYWINI